MTTKVWTEPSCWCDHAYAEHEEGGGPCKTCPPRIDGGAMSEAHAESLNKARGYAYAWYERSWCMEFKGVVDGKGWGLAQG